MPRKRRDEEQKKEEGPDWAFGLIWLGFVGAAAAAVWYAKRSDVKAIPPPPAEYEAALIAVQNLIDADPQIITLQAYHQSHPECARNPDEATGSCVSAFLRVQNYVLIFLQDIEEIEEVPPPNECDPLQTPPTGMVCVPAGQYFVLKPEAYDEVDFLQAVGENEVRFNSAYDAYAVGTSWAIRTADQWLDEKRVVGELATVSGWFGAYWDLFLSDPTNFLGRGILPSRQWEALDWPGVQQAYLQELGKPDISIGHKLALESTAVAAIRAFASEYFIAIPGNSVRILDLPMTPAVQEFRKFIARQVANFQKRTFE